MPAAKEKSPSTSCLTCETRGQTEWCVLAPADLKLIDESKITRKYLPGDVIYHQGAPCAGVFCIQSGLVGLRKVDAEGHSVLVRLAHGGDTIGYRTFLAGEEHQLGAEALKPSTLCFIPQAMVRKFLDTNPSLGLRFLQHTVRDLEETEDKFLQSATLDLKARVAHLLLVFKDRFSRPDADGMLVLDLPISRQDMAAMIGVRPETMSRAIRKFEDDGIAFFSGRQVRVPDLSVLIDQLQLDS